MRKLMLAVVVWTAGLVLPLRAQQPPQPPPQAPPPQSQAELAQKLDVLLDVWERMLPSTQTVYAEFRAIRKYNAQRGIIRMFNGQTKFMRLADGTIGARVFLQQIDQTTGKIIPDKYELVICTGRDIYLVDPTDKVIYFQTLPAAKVGQVPDQGPLAFLFGMKKAEALRRYELQVEKFDNWYTYVHVKPKFERDAQEFHRARLVILNQAVNSQQRSIPAAMPREFYWIEPNQNENTWDIYTLRQNDPARVLRTDFMKPQLPPGWQLKPMPQAPPPVAGGPGGTPPAGGQPPRVVRD
jgi:TIGR03009 family protein